MHPVPFSDLGAATREVRDELDAAWKELLAESDFVGGAPVERFEGEWARYCGTREAVGVGSGTDALVLALRALRVGPGDDVVVPANTFVATAEAVVLAGARPVFADVDPATLLLTADTLTAALTPRAAAVVAVHLYGQTVDMDAVGAVAARAGLAVVEDAAQAHGARWRGRMAGSMGHVGCFSFYPGKNLGAFGDAGAVVTADPVVADTVRALRNHGRGRTDPSRHDRVGTTSRMDTLQAAVLSAKLPRLARWTAARAAVVARYREALAGTALEPVPVAPGAEAVHHLAVVTTDERDALRAFLARRGIATAVHYPTPCHRQAPYRRHAERALPVAEAAAGRLLSLPLFPHMTDDHVDAVCTALRDHEGRRRGR